MLCYSCGITMRGNLFSAFQRCSAEIDTSLWLYRVRILCSCHNFIRRKDFFPISYSDFNLTLGNLNWEVSTPDNLHLDLSFLPEDMYFCSVYGFLEEYCHSWICLCFDVYSAPAYYSEIWLKYADTWGTCLGVCLCASLPRVGTKIRSQGSLSMHVTGGSFLPGYMYGALLQEGEW